jgi:hypothetical protein
MGNPRCPVDVFREEEVAFDGAATVVKHAATIAVV